MTIKQLLNSDYEVDLGGRLLGPELESTVGAARLGQIDVEHDAVYFGGDSSPESFSGHLSCGLDDGEVIEFIRRTNPALHDRLWGTPPSQIVTPVALAITGQLGLSDGAANDSTTTDATNGHQCDITTTSSQPNELITRRSTPTALPNFPTFITSFESCGGDMLGQSSSNEAARRQVASVSRSQNELQQDLYLLQLRRYIQSLLLNGHILVLQKVPPADAKVRSHSCGHPLCKYRHGIPAGAYRLSLESRRTLEKPIATTDKYYSQKDEDSGKYLKVKSINSRGFYCLMCLEDLFSGVGMLDDDYTSRTSMQQASLKPAGLTSAPISVDGSSEENIELRPIILQAAEKLLPQVCHINEARLRRQAKPETPAPTVFDGFGGRFDISTASDNELTRLAPTSTHGHLEDHAAIHFPSNSDQTILLRDAKRQETETTLRLLGQVAHMQEARQRSHSYSMGELPSLKISRPTDLPRRQERYKKQGLTEYNWRVWRNLLPATHFQDASAASATIGMKDESAEQLVSQVERFCHCYEPDDFKGMVQCSAEFCLVGWVHLRCSGLPRLPVKNETWYCSQCSPLFGPGTFNPALSLTPELVVESNHVLRSSVRAPSEFVDERESGNVASDELSTDETSLPLSDDESIDPTYTMPVTPRRQSKTTVGMAFTPYEFLDGAGEGQSDSLSPHNPQQTTSANISVPDTPQQSKMQSEGAKTGLTGNKRGSTPTLQSTDDPSTPTKRLKRSKSPPTPLTPPSRHVKTAFGHLAPFIYPETRTSAAALSNPQIVALEKWKSIHLYSPLAEMIKSSKSEAANSPNSCTTSPQASTTSSESLNIATLEVGGIVIVIPSIQGKKLSRVLFEVDGVVESELRKQGLTGWEQGVLGREEAVKIGKAKSSQIDEQNGVTSPKAANEVRRRISKFFSGSTNKVD